MYHAAEMGYKWYGWIQLKGTEARDFTALVFYQKYPSWALIHILNFFQFGFKFAELFYFEV
jgi:hypothetical protein